jgi:hypothetical protein
VKVNPVVKTYSVSHDSPGLYIVKDRVTDQIGEIMHAANDAAIIRTFDRMFTAGKNNFLIRDLELFRIADMKFSEGDPFPVIYNLDEAVCILRGSDYFEEASEVDTD